MTPAEVQQLERTMSEVQALAHKMGLDPYPVHFELVPATIMYEFGAYGIPGRFSHWTHGRAYQQIKTMYDYGLSKIYELVINTNPAYAFLLENNTVIQNTLVAAHVLAHVDFFKNNAYFGRSNRGMLETVSIHAERMRRYEFEHGREAVEGVLDAVLSIQEHVEPLPIARQPGARTDGSQAPRLAVDQRRGPYDDLIYIGSTPRPAAPAPEHRFPAEPQKDILRFLADHAPELEEWERDVIQMVRAEQQYFYPQMQTKIMNEGWASFWHLRILRELDLSEHEYLEFARLHSGVLAPGGRGINPYYVGLKIFEDVERRWDDSELEGKSEGDGTQTRPGMSRGRSKVFDLREVDNDASFLRNYLTEDLVEELDLYVYRRENDRWVISEKDWEIVRDSILVSMTNFGQPYIVVQDGDYRGNRELYLKHSFEGQELDADYAEKTLRFVRRLWGRPVHLETVRDGESAVLSSGDADSRARVARG